MPKKPAATPRTKRTRRTPEQARKHILDAAVRTFARKGPAAVGLKEVAEAAGVSHALITHYFETYDGLVGAAVTEAMTELRARLIERLLAIPNPTPEAVVTLYMDTALEPSYGRLVGWAFFSDHEGSAHFAELLVPDMKLIAAATEYMLGARIKPRPTRRQAEALLVSVWALVVGYVAGQNFFWRALGRKPGPSRDKDLREAVIAITRGMLS
jgi:AcrR family transcriptional regulator